LSNEAPYSHLRSGRIEILKEIAEDGTLKFNRIPIPGAALIKTADRDLLEELFCPKESTPIGTLAANPEVQVGLRYPEVLTKHMAVFGTTGSGKSYFVKHFLKGFNDWLIPQEGRILVIDTHEEYSRENPDFPHELKEEARYIKAEDIRRILSKKVLEEPSEDTDFKDVFGVTFTPEEVGILKDAYRDAQKREKESDKIEAFLSFVERFTVEEQEIDEDVLEDLRKVLESQLTDESWDKVLINGPLKAIVDLRLQEEGIDRRSRDRAKEIEDEVLEELKKYGDTYQFLKEQERLRKVSELLSSYKGKAKPAFDPSKFRKIKAAMEGGKVGFELQDVIGLIEEPGLYVLNLRDLDSEDERRSTVGDFLTAVFNKAKETRGEFKTLVVVEEAHNYAPEKVKAYSKRPMQRIASEGRKFNVGLLVVTQRPAYIAKDVIAQCNTNVIFRLVNANDIDAVASTVEAISQELLTQLPAFDTGQCIVTGVSIYQPATIMVT